MTSSCPDSRLLSEFAAGRLPDDRMAGVESHLDSCGNCQQIVEELARRSGWLPALVRGRTYVDALLSETGFRRLPSGPLALETPLGDETPTIGASRDAAGPVALPTQLGSYRLRRLIGRGGMGRVYEAVHSELDRTVAVKVLAARPGIHGDAVDRFRREMKALGRVAHPNVVTAFDAGIVDGSWYLAMEYLEGVNLSALSKWHGPPAVPDACELVRQAAIGLDHVHTLGLVHRDVKPSNLLLTPVGIVKVLDMGLALFNRVPGDADELSVPGQAIGTSAYMSPEQRRDSHRIDYRSDLYSLGATLFALLIGTPPPPGAAVLLADEAGARLLISLAAPASGARREFPRELLAVLARLLAEDPAERYQSASEAADALARFTSGCDLAALAAGSRDAATADRLSAPDERPAGQVADPSWRRRVMRPAILPAAILALAGIIVIRIVTGDGDQSTDGARRRTTIDVSGSGETTVRIRMGSPVERPPAGPTSLPGNSATERSAAEWVLSVGGAVTVLSASGAEQVEASADLPRGPLRVLSISLVNNRHATDANLSRLAGLEWLERLDLTLTPLTDDGLKHLTGLKRLRDLLLAGTRITSAGVEHLPHLAGPEQVRDRGHGRPHSAPLAGLSLHDTRVDDEGLRFIGRLHRLESLALSGTRVTDGGLSSLSGLENLRSLSLIRTGVGDAGLAHLAKLPRLRELSLQRTFVTANGVGEFQAARPACTIHWNQSPAAARPDAAAGHPGGSTRSAQAAIERAVAEWVITRLGQVKPHHCPDTIGRLSDLPSDNFLIQTIDLWPLKDVDDEDLARLTELAHLQILNLSRTAVSDRGTTELARIRTLTHLQLGHTGITDTGVEHLTELKNLRLLALNGTRVTDAGLRHVSRLAALTYLDLGETGVTSAGLRALRPLTGLHVLLLRGTAVDDEGVAELSAFRELRKLDLGGTRITDASVETLVKLTGLTELTVSDTALTVAGCRRLREGLAGCEVIE